MTWALRRQLFYIGILIMFFLGFGYFISYPYLNKEPTCFDSRQNGDETGTDCGGSCVRACMAQVDRVTILWSRAFKIVPGRYNAVAYLENPNPNVAAEEVHYRFRFADKDNIYIGKREGVTVIPPSGRFAVFEPAIDFGSSIPVYTTFEFTENPLWLQVSEDKVEQIKILVSNINLTDEITNPKLSATIKNNSLFTIPDLGVVTILYDSSNNAVSASQTYLEELGAKESSQVNFTWPEPMPTQIVLKELVPIYNIFRASLK